MTEKKEFAGCGFVATRMIVRGPTKPRIFTCERCLPRYEGSGRPLQYRTDTRGVEPEKGFYSGPARVCGQSVPV